MTARTKKKSSTYRFTPELDALIEAEARRLGVSKNAYVQMELAKLMKRKAG